MASPQFPAPDFKFEVSPPSGGVIRKVSLALLTCSLAVFVWRCGFVLVHERYRVNEAVEHLHSQLSSDSYEQIYNEADEGFREEQRHDQIIDFLRSIRDRLGDA